MIKFSLMLSVGVALATLAVWAISAIYPATTMTTLAIWWPVILCAWLAGCAISPRVTRPNQ